MKKISPESLGGWKPKGEPVKRVTKYMAGKMHPVTQEKSMNGTFAFLCYKDGFTDIDEALDYAESIKTKFEVRVISYIERVKE